MESQFPATLVLLRIEFAAYYVLLLTRFTYHGLCFRSRRPVASLVIYTYHP